MFTNESWNLEEVAPKIFLLTFDVQYDLAMTFLRYQEFYESDNPQFRNKKFTILDFMEGYSKKHNGYFSYPLDWSGFNVPGQIILSLLNGKQIDDWNQYDSFMKTVVETIGEKMNYSQGWGQQFYLIGAVSHSTDDIHHEIAHGLYYSNLIYKKEMITLIKKYSKVQQVFNKYLSSIGYVKNVFDDEMQAYFSTGLNPEIKKLFKRNKIKYKKAQRSFRESYRGWGNMLCENI